MTRSHLICGVLALTLSACSYRAASSPPSLSMHDRAPGTATLAAWAMQYGASPEDYIIGKFQHHDVVLLGEAHLQAQDLELVQSVLPRLYAAGIYVLGTEFVRRVDQPLIDSLLSLEVYDEGLAQEILFRKNVTWGYQEYMDVFRAAWMVNRNRPPGGRLFRVLGVNNSPDFSHIRTPAEADDPERRALVWHGETEQHWARVILDSVIAKGDKILVHSGAHHSFSEFLQPVVSNGVLLGMESQRVGNFLFRRLGKRVITVYLHAPWQARAGGGTGWVAPAEGAIDAVIARLPSDRRRIGFDLTNTPFGRLRDSSSIYAVGHDGLTLERMYDGYIVAAPLAEVRAVRVIPGYINERNIAFAREQTPDAAFRRASVEEFMAAIANDALLVARRAHEVAERLPSRP